MEGFCRSVRSPSTFFAVPRSTQYQRSWRHEVPDCLVRRTTRRSTSETPRRQHLIIVHPPSSFTLAELIFCALQNRDPQKAGFRPISLAQECTQLGSSSTSTRQLCPIQWRQLCWCGGCRLTLVVPRVVVCVLCVVPLERGVCVSVSKLQTGTWQFLAKCPCCPHL